MTSDKENHDHVDKLTREFAARKPMQQAKSQAKPVPTVWKHIIKFEWFRKFTFLERIAILFGSNLVVAAGVSTQHSPGAIQPLVLGKVTHETEPSEYMMSIVAGMIEEQKSKGGAVVQSEPEAKP